MSTSENELPAGEADTPAADATPAPAPAPAPVPPADNRRKQLRDLLSIPERDRTDEQWDQIIELEIQLAPGNRLLPHEQATPAPRHGKGGGNPGKKPHAHPRPGGGGGGGGGNKNRRPRGNKGNSGGNAG